MNRFTTKNKITICLVILLLITIIITNYMLFINQQKNSNLNTKSSNNLSESNKIFPKTVEISVNYVLPSQHIYNSKEELFNSFFSSLYYYIIEEHPDKGIPHLKSLGINSIEDALNVCKNWNENDSTGLPLVGKAFSPYFLQNKAGSDFKYQKDKETFIGHCLRNYEYIEFLYFLKKFFYYFRLDEGYTIIKEDGTIKNPEGTDFFASSYASIIDTAKFFYYSKETLPYYFHSTNNIPNLYDKIPGVLKSQFKNNVTITYDTDKDAGYELPYDLDCYGYKIHAWYDDEDCLEPSIKIINNDFIEKHSFDDKIKDKMSITLFAVVERVGEFAEEYNNDFQ